MGNITERATNPANDRERVSRIDRDAYVMRMPERRSVGPSHLCPANRLFPTFLQHAKLVSGPIYPRPVSAIHTKHEKLTTKAIRYNCIVHSSVKRVIVAVVCLNVGIAAEEEKESYLVLLQ